MRVGSVQVVVELDGVLDKSIGTSSSVLSFPSVPSPLLLLPSIEISASDSSPHPHRDPHRKTETKPQTHIIPHNPFSRGASSQRSDSWPPAASPRRAVRRLGVRVQPVQFRGVGERFFGRHYCGMPASFLSLPFSLCIPPLPATTLRTHLPQPPLLPLNPSGPSAVPWVCPRSSRTQTSSWAMRPRVATLSTK